MEAAYALAGIVIGAILSWIGAAISDRSKRRHETLLLVRNEKLHAYTVFTSEAKAYMALLYSVAASLGIDQQTEKLTLEDATASLDKAFRARDRAFEEIRLVGSDAVIASAREWTGRFYAMREYLDSPKHSQDEWADLVGRANEARSAFYTHAREELEIA